METRHSIASALGRCTSLGIPWKRAGRSRRSESSSVDVPSTVRLTTCQRMHHGKDEEKAGYVQQRGRFFVSQALRRQANTVNS